VLPAGFHVYSSEFRPIPGPELTGSGWICRGQRVVLLLLLVVVLSVLLMLLLVAVVVVLLVA
jgi:hypothetical protein